MKLNSKILTIFIASFSLILIAFLCIICFIFSMHGPHDGIWVCDDPYIWLNADTNLFAIEEDGKINEYHIGYGDEIYFTVGIKEGDNVHYLYKGSIIQYGEKVHIKSDEGGFDCWLYRAK